MQQEEGKCHRVLKTLKAIDYFKFDGKPRHISGHTTSICGVAGTILLLLIVGGYMASATTRFFTDPPSVSLTQTPALHQNHKMVLSCFHLPKINDLNYFSTRLQMVELFANGSTKSQTDLNMSKPDDNQVCIDSTSETGDERTVIRNFCNPGNCKYLKFKVWNCGCPDHNNPNKNRSHAAGTCASTAEISYILEGNYVSVHFETILGLVVLNAAPKFSSAAFYRQPFAVNETILNPDLIRTFTEQTNYHLVAQQPTYSIGYFFDPAKAPTKEVLRVDLIMAPHVLLTTLNRATILDLVGSFGAFFSVIAGALAIIFGTYNMNAFYEKNPKWAMIDESFKVEQGDDDAITHEAQKLLQKATQNSDRFSQGTTGMGGSNYGAA